MNYQISIFFRVLNASIGAYVLATLLGIVIPELLLALFSIRLADAVYFSLLVSYFIFFAVVIVSFAINSVKHLYIGMVSVSLLFASVIYGVGN